MTTLCVESLASAPPNCPMKRVASSSALTISFARSFTLLKRSHRPLTAKNGRPSIAALALDYVVMHEQAHIVRGHTGYAAKAGLKRLGERGEECADNNGRNDADKLRRGFEIQADWDAAWMFGRHVDDLADGRLPVSPPLEPVHVFVGVCLSDDCERIRSVGASHLWL